MIDLDIFICLDHCGDYATGNTPEEAKERYEETVQALSETEGFRIVKLAVKAPLAVVIEATASIKAEKNTVTCS